MGMAFVHMVKCLNGSQNVMLVFLASHMLTLRKIIEQLLCCL
jgi:hypothetical protein